MTASRRRLPIMETASENRHPFRLEKNRNIKWHSAPGFARLGRWPLIIDRDAILARVITTLPISNATRERRAESRPTPGLDHAQQTSRPELESFLLVCLHILSQRVNVVGLVVNWKATDFHGVLDDHRGLRVYRIGRGKEADVRHVKWV